MSNRTRPSSMALDLERCMNSGEISSSSARRVGPTLQRAVEFFESRGVTDLGDVTHTDAKGFILSRLDSGLTASVSVLHNRRSALRLFFMVARRLNLADGDPTLDIELPPKSSAASRPLDDDEIGLRRDIADWATQRVAVSWALAEATARGAEIAAITRADVDVERATVWIAGGPRTLARRGTLTDWGRETLQRSFETAGSDALTSSSPGLSGQVSTCRAISSVLVRAGLAGEPDVRPMSVAAWAGRRVLDRTGSIEATALAVGVRSLDRAARLVGHDWMA